MKNNRYCVIMCGGVGSRFWPFSRTDKPKQFIDFMGTGRSLLQMTYDRVRPLVDPDHIILLTNKDYAHHVREQLPDIREENILCEPARRNTAPCICWAAHHIIAQDPDASIMTLPADHLILKEGEFHEAMRQGLDFVESQDALLTLGIVPRNPNTGYGYIQATMACTDFPGIMKVKSFTEKPDKQMAELFISTGEFYWNSGIFLWTAKTILESFKTLAPELATAFDADPTAYGTPAEQQFIDSIYDNLTNISIDYAVMEKATNVYVKTVDLGWSDLGTWKALFETSPKNREGNVTQNCKALTHDCTGSVFAVSGDKIVVAAGLKDYIVADNGNALLIYPIGMEQKIRQVVHDVATRFGKDFV